MIFTRKPKPLIAEGKSWRAFQAKLQRSQRISSCGEFCRARLKLLVLVPTIGLVLYGIFAGFDAANSYFRDVQSKSHAPAAPKAEPREPAPPIAKEALQNFLPGSYLANIHDNRFEIRQNSKPLTVYTSIDVALQRFLESKLDKKNSRYIGIVVMEPASGRILALVGYDKLDPSNNPCLDSSFPAASIFKIITAAAAVEKCDLESDSELYYNGRKHTLYKSQLKEDITKWTTRISLKDSFAESVNPVFGKLGALYLRSQLLKDYAEAFGFNRTISSEIPVAPSQTEVSDEPYELAEIASGFNRKTRMSPLHGALIAATILNRGKLIEPAIVDRITDEQGRDLYRSQPVTVDQAMTPQTSEVVGELMEATVRSGTARREFRRYRRDKILSRLDIGGKTGSINNRDDDARFDWFVGYAKEKHGDKAIVISAMVAHEEYIGIRAMRYARMTIQEYFQNIFAGSAASESKS
jgi:peptidoglycan glycosyltransferase